MKERRFRTVTANIVICVVLGAVLATTVAALSSGSGEVILAGNAVYEGDPESGRVALMFNVYEGTGYVEEIAALIADRGWNTTFFVGGKWAERNGISHATARQKAGRGGFLTARKVGRDWMISAAEPNTDHRIKLPQKNKLSPSDPVYMYKLLNYLYRLNLGNLPDTVNENKSHINYCKRLFMQIRGGFTGNTLKLFDLICDKMTIQEGADAYYIPHEEIMSALDDEAWHTQNNGSASNSGVTIDFKDYLNILKNTASDMLSRCVELKVNHQTQTVFMPWYHSLSWENTRQGGLYFIPNNFFKMIILELN